jgi:hypothetical protein
MSKIKLERKTIYNAVETVRELQERHSGLEGKKPIEVTLSQLSSETLNLTTMRMSGKEPDVFILLKLAALAVEAIENYGDDSVLYMALPNTEAQA